MSNICPYKNCSLNCMTKARHRSIYAQMNKKNESESEIVIQKSTKINWDVYEKLFPATEVQNVKK